MPAPSKAKAPIKAAPHAAKKPKVDAVAATKSKREPETLASHRTVKPDDPACAPQPTKGTSGSARAAVNASTKAPKLAASKASAPPAAKPPPVAPSISAAAASSKPAQSKGSAPPAAKTAPVAPSTSAAGASSEASGTGDGVLDYLRQLSAPTNAQLIAEHFRGALGKSEAEKRCTDLVSKGHLNMREAGKLKLFWASQLGVAALTAQEEAQLGRDLADVKAQRATHAARIGELQAAINMMKTSRSLEQVREEMAAAREKTKAAVDKVEALRKEQGGGQPMSASDEAKVKKDYVRLRKLYLERRRTCLEVLDNMSEGCGKSTKVLIEELGLETDAECGVTKDQFPVLS